MKNKKCALQDCWIPRLDGKIYCAAHWKQWNEITILGIDKKLIASYVAKSDERDYSNMCLGCLTDLYDELVTNLHFSPAHPLIVEILGQMEERMNENS